MPDRFELRLTPIEFIVLHRLRDKMNTFRGHYKRGAVSGALRRLRRKGFIAYVHPDAESSISDTLAVARELLHSQTVPIATAREVLKAARAYPTFYVPTLIGHRAADFQDVDKWNASKDRLEFEQAQREEAARGNAT